MPSITYVHHHAYYTSTQSAIVTCSLIQSLGPANLIGLDHCGPPWALTGLEEEGWSGPRLQYWMDCEVHCESPPVSLPSPN
jgi:hypothetical protein